MVLGHQRHLGFFWSTWRLGFEVALCGGQACEPGGAAGQDSTRDKERDAVQAFSEGASQYAQQAELGQLMGEMLQSLLLAKPESPVDHLIGVLEQPVVRRVAVCAPPGLRMEGVVKAVASELGLLIVSVPPLLDQAKDRLIEGKTVADHGSRGKEVPDAVVAKLVAERLAEPDCAEKGWVLEGMPATRGQAQRLVAAGMLPEKVIVLSAPDDMIFKSTTDDKLKKNLPKKLQLYHKQMSQMEPVLSSVVERFECEGNVDAEGLLPSILRSLRRKQADPALVNSGA